MMLTIILPSDNKCQKNKKFYINKTLIAINIHKLHFLGYIMKNNNENLIGLGTEGTYRPTEQGIEKNNELITENNTQQKPPTKIGVFLLSQLLTR